MASIHPYKLKNGKTKYEYFISNGRDKGTGNQIKIHKRGFLTYDEAAKAAKIIEGQMAAGEYTKNNPNKMTISSFLDVWITEYKASVKEGTRIVYRDTIRMYINPYIGNYQLQDYDRNEHQKFINKLFTNTKLGKNNDGLSWNTVKVVNGTLSNAFKKAIQLGYVKENPTQFVEFPYNKKKNKTVSYFTEEQVDLFLDTAKEEREKLWFIFFLIIFDLGLRKAEVMALRWSDFDLKENKVSITKERLYRHEKPGEVVLDDTKTPSGVRELYLTSRLKSSLIGYYNFFYLSNNIFPITKGNNDFLSTYTMGSNKGYPIRSRSANTAWERIIRKAKLPKIKIHDGRHTHAVRLRQAGVPLDDIKDLLGHKDVKMTQVYAHISPEVKIRAISKLDEYIDQEKKTL